MVAGKGLTKTAKNKTGTGEDLVVFSIINESECSECGSELPRGSFLRLEEGKPLCLECADLDHLVFLPSGDMALTRRSRKYSPLSAVVVRFSRARRRYERQGLLVDSDALDRAEKECLSDEDRRQLQRERAALARERDDARYIAEFADQIRRRYPACPPDEADAIARHACAKYSGRVGRSAAAKEFDSDAIDLAIGAHVRHAHTNYDSLLSGGWDRREARLAVSPDVERVMDGWRGGFFTKQSD